MINIKELLYEISEDKRVYDDKTDLIESGILDSYAFIELFSKLEDAGYTIHPTKIDRTKLRTIRGIEEIIEENTKNSQKEE